MNAEQMNTYGADIDPEDAPPIRTPEEIAELKRQWLADGCWDIEDTEGFEAHYTELRRWREAHEAEQHTREVLRLTARGEALGFSYTQMKFIESLERQIRDLGRKLDAHTEREA